MARISVVVLAPEPAEARAAIVSVVRQEGCDLEVVVAAPEGGPDLPASRVLRHAPDAAPAAIRNEALAAATGTYVCLLEPGERLDAKDALARQVAALEAEPLAVGSYGRTEVLEDAGPRVRPERGRGGWILRRLVQHRTLVASAASVTWRRALLPAGGFDASYRTPSGLLLALLVTASRDHPFLFQPTTVARAAPRREDVTALEEHVKIFVALLYGATKLDERLEARVRFRLARSLVALGKYHYRRGDHARAGKLFGEAVKVVPSYFRGRRYQFMNFLKGVIAR